MEASKKNLLIDYLQSCRMSVAIKLNEGQDPLYLLEKLQNQMAHAVDFLEESRKDLNVPELQPFNE